MKLNKMTFVYVGLSVLFIYLFILIFIFFSQRSLMYHPSENNYLDENKLDHKIEKIKIPSDDHLISWYFKKNESFKTLLFFHGNAGSLENRIYKLNDLSKLNLNYLIVAYRGFSGNKGTPTEDGLYKDARSAKYWLNLNNIGDQNIIVYGESLGTAVAIDLAKDHKFAGVILESPFTSMLELSRKYYPWLPTRLLLKDKYETNKKIKKVFSPILILHGRKDNIVPFNMGEELLDQANDPKYNYFVDDDHMMDFNKDLIKSIEQFLNSLK
jgi:fermentation-respiration switch protein FrsA (DUF1100 family)|tara:strand:- start:18 stop:824 length:807 start_codon:yes stop_codon:yes gene_type:complete